MSKDADEGEARRGSEPTRLQQQRPPLRALRGGGSAELAANVRLRREFKGLTAQDLLRNEALLAALPGQVRSALQALRRGDMAAAEACLPGGFEAAAGRIVPGPGHHRSRRLAWLRLWVFVLASAMLVILLLVFA
jgi:hypothetical protein